LTIGTESGRDWTVALRRQQARTAEGQPTGCYTNTFEIICRDCGDDPSRDYNNVPPRLQRIRGPYEIDAGLTVYQAHVAWHEELARARQPGATGRGPSLDGHRAPLERADEADLHGSRQ
jgi:hypothetical protein